MHDGDWYSHAQGLAHQQEQSFLFFLIFQHECQTPQKSCNRKGGKHTNQHRQSFWSCPLASQLAACSVKPSSCLLFSFVAAQKGRKLHLGELAYTAEIALTWAKAGHQLAVNYFEVNYSLWYLIFAIQFEYFHNELGVEISGRLCLTCYNTKNAISEKSTFSWFSVISRFASPFPPATHLKISLIQLYSSFASSTLVIQRFASGTEQIRFNLFVHQC